jgi:hypothetical protein
MNIQTSINKLTNGFIEPYTAEDQLRDIFKAEIIKVRTNHPLTNEPTKNGFIYIERNTNEEVCNTSETHTINNTYHNEMIPQYFDNCYKIDAGFKVKIEHASLAKVSLSAYFPKYQYELYESPAVDDTIGLFSRHTNSIDQTWSLSTMLMTKRILCLNGMLGDLKVAMSVQKHKGLISAERSITPMQIGSEVYLQNKELYNNMASEKITRQVVEEFFDKYLCKNKYSNTNKYKDDTNKKRLENLMHIYSDNTFHLGNTKWALYNALTFWASHPDKTNDVRQSTLNSTASLIDKRTKREGEIRSVLNKTNL